MFTMPVFPKQFLSQSIDPFGYLYKHKVQDIIKTLYNLWESIKDWSESEIEDPSQRKIEDQIFFRRLYLLEKDERQLYLQDNKVIDIF